MLRSFRIALAFLTIIPAFGIDNWRDDDFKKSVTAYPLVGLVIAAIVYGLALLLSAYSPILRAALVLTLWFVLTGALHFDGLCDIADALFVAKPSSERQVIARDPRIGSFALLSGVLLIILKLAALLSVANSFILIAPILARSVVVIIMPWFKLQSSSQMAKAAIIEPRQAFATFSYGLLISLLIARQFKALSLSILAIVILLIIVFSFAAWASKRMNGLNGDVYGAIIEISELAFLLLIALFNG